MTAARRAMSILISGLRPIRADSFSITATRIEDSAVSAREARNLRPQDQLKFWALRAAVGARVDVVVGDEDEGRRLGRRLIAHMTS